jgi:hypothetical protein
MLLWGRVERSRREEGRNEVVRHRVSLPDNAVILRLY